MKRWNADFYAPLTWLPGFAIADPRVQVFQLRRGVGGYNMLLCSMNLAKARDRAKFPGVRASCVRYLIDCESRAASTRGGPTSTLC